MATSTDILYSNTMAHATASLSPSKKRSRTIREHAGTLTKAGSGKRICVEHVGEDQTVASFAERPYHPIITYHDSAKEATEIEEIHNDIIKEAAEQYNAMKNELDETKRSQIHDNNKAAKERADLEQQLASIEAKLESTTTTAEHEKRNLEATMAQWKIDAEKYKEGVDSQLNDGLTNGRTEVDRIKQDAHDVKEQLETQLATASKENAELKRNAREAKERYEASLSAANEANRQLEQQYEVKITAAWDESSRIREEARQLKGQYETHVANMRAENERITQQAEQADQQHNTQIAAAQAEKRQVTLQVEQMKQQHETELDTLRQEIVRVTQLKEQSEAQHGTRLRAAQEENGRITQEATRATERLRQQESTSSQKINELEQQIRACSAQYDGMQRQLATQQQSNSGLQEQVQQLSNKLHEVQQEYTRISETHRNVLQQLEESNAAAQQQMELKQQYFTKWTELAKQMEEGNPLTPQVEEQSQTIRDLEDAVGERDYEYKQLYEYMCDWNCHVSLKITSTMAIDAATDFKIRRKATTAFLKGMSQELNRLREFYNDWAGRVAAEKAAQLEVERQEALKNADGDIERMIDDDLCSLLVGPRGGSVAVKPEGETDGMDE